MKKLSQNKGFTLIEMLVCIMILVILIVAMGPGMKTAFTVYKEAVFHSDSSNMVSMINTSFTDMFRYSKDITNQKNADGNFTLDGSLIQGCTAPNGTDFLFTNNEYGIKNGYLVLTNGKIVINNSTNSYSRELINSGAYPSMKITAFSCTYDAANNLFHIEYTVESTSDSSMTKSSELYVRTLN